MTFNDLHLKHMYQNVTTFLTLMRRLLTDKRLRPLIIILMISVVFISFISSQYTLQKNWMEASVVKLSAQTTEIQRRIQVRKHHAQIPKFEASMTAAGAYHPPLPADVCISHISRCFLHKNKPKIAITVRKQDVEPLHTVQSFDVKFKSSFDYEILDMMDYILSNPSKFGYTRLREFEIEQLFEASPIVKGQFVYDQMSLTP